MFEVSHRQEGSGSSKTTESSSTDIVPNSEEDTMDVDVAQADRILGTSDALGSFLLSKYASDFGINVVFCTMPNGAPGPVVVHGGFRVDSQFMVSASKFIRWLCLYDGRKTPLPESSLALRKIEIVPSDPFQYWFAHQSERVFEHDSKVLIQPGIYGIYNPGQDGKPYQKAFEPPEPITRSFRELEDITLREQLEDQGVLTTAELSGSLAESSVVSTIKKEQFLGAPADHLVADALVRYEHRCPFTGRTDNLLGVHIFAPVAGGYQDKHAHSNRKTFASPENTIIMSADIVDAFWENFFSVDMEDGARIITFRPLPENAPKLFTHLSRKAQEIADTNIWTLNLRWSLRVNWDIGDAKFDYPDEDIEDYFPLAEKDPWFTHERWKQGIARHFREVMEVW